MSKKLIAFPWYGGKFAMIKYLLPLFPREKVTHYVEVFGGSGALLLNIDPPYPIETYNDIDGQCVNFFRVLRDEPKKLISLLELTPYSKEELKIAVTEPNPECPIEKARRFYVRARQGFNAQAHTSTWSFNKLKVNGRTTVKWRNSMAKLWAVMERMREVQIDNDTAVKVIERFDSPETFFYCDPPYVHSTRHKSHRKDYAYEMTDDQHIELSAALNKIKGKALVSGFDSDLYNTLYNNWYSTRIMLPKSSSKGIIEKKVEFKTEVVWSNFIAAPQQSLFDPHSVESHAQ